jgi:hypothetical protein
MRRGIDLTTEGQRVFPRHHGCAHSDRQCGASDAGEPGRKLLRQMLPPTFAIRRLVSRLHGFMPVDVQITTSLDPADFDREDVDACLHSDLVAPIGPEISALGWRGAAQPKPIEAVLAVTNGFKAVRLHFSTRVANSIEAVAVSARHLHSTLR